VEAGAVRSCRRGRIPGALARQRDADQQKRALDWLVKKACRTYDLSYRPGEDGRRDTDFAEGQRSIGLQVVKLLNIKIGLLTKGGGNMSTAAAASIDGRSARIHRRRAGEHRSTGQHRRRFIDRRASRWGDGWRQRMAAGSTDPRRT
jgi:hypothetical protein